jgi:hypothetical protein
MSHNASCWQCVLYTFSLRARVLCMRVLCMHVLCLRVLCMLLLCQYMCPVFVCAPYQGVLHACISLYLHLCLSGSYKFQPECCKMIIVLYLYCSIFFRDS